MLDDEEETIESYKIILIGDSGVGKTSIINRFSNNTFNETHIATIGVDFRYKNIDIDGTPIRLQVWDTAGQERFQAISRNFYRGAQGVIIVYAVNDAYSFQNTRKWLTEIETSSLNGDGTAAAADNSAQPIVKYLVGNKSDLMKTRCIDERRGRAEAETYQVKFFETSAMNSQNINELFMEIARDIKATNPSAHKSSKTKLDGNAPDAKSSGCC